MKQEQFYIAGIDFSDDSYEQVELDRKLELVLDALEKINMNALKQVGSDVIILVVLHEYFFTPISISSSDKKKCLQKISDKIKKYPNMVIIPGSFSNFKNEPDSRLSPEKLEKKIKATKEAYQIADSNKQHHNVYDFNNLIFALNYFNLISLLKNNKLKTAVFLMNCAYAMSSTNTIKHYKRFMFYEKSLLPSSFVKNYVYAFKYNELIQNISVKGIQLSVLMTVCFDHKFIDRNSLVRKKPDIHVIPSNFISVKEDHLLGKINIQMDERSGLSVYVNKSDYNSDNIRAMLYRIDPNNPGKEKILSVNIKKYQQNNAHANFLECNRLINNGKLNINKNLDEALYFSVREGNPYASKYLFKKGAKPNLQTYEEHNTALFIACSVGDDEHVELLLSNHANAKHQNKRGQTPLWIAAQNGHLKAVEALIKAGANINQADNNGDTPLLIAAKNRHLKVMAILLENGANIKQANSAQESPTSIATEKKDIEMMEILLKHHDNNNQEETNFSEPSCICYF